MRFELRHALPRSPEVAWAAMFGAKYEAAVSAASALDHEVLDEGPRGALFFRRSRIRSAKRGVSAISGTSTSACAAGEPASRRSSHRK